MMLRIRGFEDRLLREFAKGDMPGFVHTYHGAEPVAAGVCAHLTDDDIITSTHRGHGHCIAKGCDLSAMVAELYGRETGLCKGPRADRCTSPTSARAFSVANAIVGGGISLAVGAALAASVLGDGRVAVSFFGDGASNQGIFHESLNLASIWRLPVVFVCENNGWGRVDPDGLRHQRRRHSGQGPGLQHGKEWWSTDPTTWRCSPRPATPSLGLGAGEGPTLVEAKITRMRGHYVGDPEQYRSREQRRTARGLDPVARLVGRH